MTSEEKKNLFEEYKAFYETEIYSPESPYQRRNLSQAVIGRYNAYWMRLAKEDKATQWVFGMVGWSRDLPFLEVDMGIENVLEKVAVMREVGVEELLYRGPSDDVCDLIKAGCSVIGAVERGDEKYLIVEVSDDLQGDD